MEALAGANAALLTIWDLTKMVEPDLLIEGVRKAIGKVRRQIWFMAQSSRYAGWVREKMCPPASQALKDI